MTVVIGLTGGIASGKTTVANLFHNQFGIEIIDADIIARDVVKPGTTGLTALIEYFGNNILLANGELDRSLLRQKIFTKPQDKQWVNQLLHPLIRSAMLSQITAAQGEYVLLVVPLLIENQLQHLCERILVVDIDTETQIQRTILRDQCNREQAIQILAAQTTRENRLAFADDVIHNNVDKQQLLLHIFNFHQNYLAIAKQNLRK